jgi:signal peptidase I
MRIVKRDAALFLDLSERLLEDGYRVRFRANGMSMQPTIRDGDAVTVGPVDPADVTCGEILLYRRRQRAIANRVVDVHRSGSTIAAFVLRGDAKAACDAPVAPEQVVGTVVAIERQSGRAAAVTWRAGVARMRGASRGAWQARFVSRLASR